MNLYFDNCATSFPKPSAVAEAMSKHLNETGSAPMAGQHIRGFCNRPDWWKSAAISWQDGWAPQKPVKSSLQPMPPPP